MSPAVESGYGILWNCRYGYERRTVCADIDYRATITRRTVISWDEKALGEPTEEAIKKAVIEEPEGFEIVDVLDQYEDDLDAVRVDVFDVVCCQSTYASDSPPPP